MQSSQLWRLILISLSQSGSLMDSPLNILWASTVLILLLWTAHIQSFSPLLEGGLWIAITWRKGPDAPLSLRDSSDFEKTKEDYSTYYFEKRDWGNSSCVPVSLSRKKGIRMESDIIILLCLMKVLQRIRRLTLYEKPFRKNQAPNELSYVTFQTGWGTLCGYVSKKEQKSLCLGQVPAKWDFGRG